MNNYLDKFSLAKKTSFVAGGAGLLGTEVVKALLDAGSKVIILDVDKKKALNLQKSLQKKKKNVFFEFFDGSDLNNANKNLDNLYLKYGRVDVWVNTFYPKTPDWGKKVEDLSLNSWRKNVDMHLNSYSWISRKVCMLMKKQKSGSLINFGSIYGVVGNNFEVYKGTKMSGPMAYAAIKGGIVNLDRYLASYFGVYNVRINTICPGGIFDNQDEKFVENYARLTPLKRMGSSEEIASAVLFLASDAASYVTGTELMVDGGWTAV